MILDADYSLKIETKSGDTIPGDHVTATLYNGAFLTSGFGTKYIQLDGVDDYMDLGDNSNNCLGNLELCPTGLTLSIWIRSQATGRQM